VSGRGLSRRVVSTGAAPAAIGPYSQAIVANGFVFTSGQIPLDPATGAVVEGGIVEQTERTFENLGAVLRAAGSDFDKIVQCSVFLASLKDFAVMNDLYARRFTIGPPPARITVEVAGLPRGVLIEIAATALAHGGAD
jgi:2-iminobutanoate/2-iminopropanoate deaminase